MLALKRLLLFVVLLAAGAAAGVALHTALTQGDTMFAGKRPQNLGHGTGRLAPCKSTPNCVSSQADPKDEQHYIAPISLKSDPIAAVRKAVESLPRTSVVQVEPDYLYAEFRSKLMGFVDDVEFLADRAKGVVHVRSAARLGRRDFGVNRERIEQLRSILEKRIRS
ncbi:MAG TPA: DUF1499 domain-containing protein [Burkholderiales bacterium]|nr:DUF1499 domain-containing protein [Burkholderiales bacterium]